MQTFALSQVQAAQDYRPQIERFITSDAIYVIETLADYLSPPDVIQQMITLRNEVG